jgi:hypothetical protein
MTAPYTGRCACGAVSITITAEPIAARQCWCQRCQKIAAGGATNNAIFPVDAISVDGTLKEATYVAASGNILTHAFCPGCGVQVLGKSSGRPAFDVVRLGVLDHNDGLGPTAAIWTAEAPAWATIDPALERHEQQPPPTVTTPPRQQ